VARGAAAFLAAFESTICWIVHVLNDEQKTSEERRRGCPFQLRLLTTSSRRFLPNAVPTMAQIRIWSRQVQCGVALSLGALLRRGDGQWDAGAIVREEERSTDRRFGVWYRKLDRLRATLQVLCTPFPCPNT